jgi:Ca2+-binding EF-hand superfamily protein
MAAGPQYAGLFEALDTNGDGFLDGEEIDRAADFLRKLDINGDGDVSQREVFHAVGHFRAPSRRPSAVLFQALDPNGDMKISRTDLLQAPALLLKLDQDGDGKVALREAN